MSKASEVVKQLLLFIFGRGEVDPRLPLLHEAQQLQLIVSLKDKLLNQSRGDFVLNSADRGVFINDLHTETSQLTRQKFVGVFVGQDADFVKSEVVELHQLHSWEGLHIEEGNACGKFKGSFMVHIFLMIEHALPHRPCLLGLADAVWHGCGVLLVGVYECLAEAALRYF